MEKTFAKGVFIKEKTFDTWSKLNMSIRVDEFIKFIKEHENEKGHVNFNITKRRQPSEGGITHSCELDTWKPENKEESKQEAESSDDLPF